VKRSYSTKEDLTGEIIRSREGRMGRHDSLERSRRYGDGHADDWLENVGRG
jgi:hypothetical protein